MLTHNSRAGNPKRTLPNCHRKEVNSNQRGLQHTKKFGGPKTPLSELKGPENPGVVAPFAFAGCRGNRMRAVLRRLMKFDLRPCPLRLRSSLFCGGACSSWTSLTRLLRLTAVVCSSTRWSMSLLCCATEFRRCSQVSLSVAYERHVTSMTHRIACLRAVHVTALPYFTRLPVSCLSQQTREQARAVTEFSVLLAVFYHFRFSLGFGSFPNFWVQPSRPRLPARVGPFTSSVCKVLRVQFLAKF